jgi:HK97 family phage prohead protease
MGFDPTAEVRMNYAGSPFDIKALDDSGRIEGLLAGFGDVDLGGDKLQAGCFAKSLAARVTPLPMLLHHNSSRPIGAWKEWQEKSDGLYVKGKLTLAVTDAQEAYALAKDGALTGLSIGWRAKGQTVDQRTGVRTVTEAELFEGSLVTVPMHQRTRVTDVKAITGARDIAELLQEAGISGRRAKAAAGAAWKAINEQSNEAAEAELAEILKSSLARLSAKGGR